MWPDAPPVAMRQHIQGSGPETVFVVEAVPPEWTAPLSDLGFWVDGTTATRPVDHHSRHVEIAFANLATHLPTMVAQHIGTMSVPWAESLSRLTGRLEDSGIDWMLIGTAALAKRGVAVTPGDVDVVTDERGAQLLADLYRDELVFPVMHWPGMGLFGRAFDGVRVEWLGNEGLLSGSMGPWRPTESVRWNGCVIRVPSLEAQLAVEESRGRVGHVAAIHDVLGRRNAQI